MNWKLVFGVTNRLHFVLLKKTELNNFVKLQASNGATQSSGACGGQVEEDDEESSSSSLTASSAVEVRISILSWNLSALMKIVMNHV